MGTGSDGYQFVLLLHITAVVLGFGPLMLNGIYGRLASARGGGEGLAISEANQKVSQTAGAIAATVPLFGIALVLMSDDTWGFDQLWISLSFLLFIVIAVVALAVLVPSHRRLNELAGELVATGPGGAGGSGRPPQLAQMEQLGRKMAMFGGIVNLLVIITIGLMIWKPGA